MCRCNVRYSILSTKPIKNVHAKSINTSDNAIYEKTTQVNLKELNLTLVNGEPKASRKNNLILNSLVNNLDEQNISKFDGLIKNQVIKDSVIQSIKQGRKPVAIATKSVYVGKDDHLLTKKEVEKFGHPPVGRHNSQTKGLFTLSINVSVSDNGVYWLQAGGAWNTRNMTELNTSNSPGRGDDFIGLGWGSNYCTMSNPSATGSYTSGDTFTPAVSNIPNQGEIWSFQDDEPELICDHYANRVYAGVGVKTVGNLQYTSFVASYVHTWAQLSYSASFNGASGSISVTPADKS